MPIVPPSVTAPPGAPASPRVWSVAGTLAWAIGLYAVMVASSIAAMGLVVAWYGDVLPRERDAFLNHGVMMAATTSAALTPLLTTLGIAAHCRGRSLADYLALRWPSRRAAATGVLAILALLAALDGLSWLMGRPLAPRVMIEAVISARDTDSLAFFAFGILVAAPVGEEAVFRGFIYRGLAESRAGPLAAVVLTAVIFAAMHVQYDLFVIAEIVAIGVVLGAARMASGSTSLTMLMHALYNAVALVQAMFIIKG